MTFAYADADAACADREMLGDRIWRGARLRAYVDVLVLLAGPLAEARFRRLPCTPGTLTFAGGGGDDDDDGDVARAKRILRLLAAVDASPDPDGDVEGTFAAIAACAARALRRQRRWAAIVTCAAQLDRKLFMSADDFAEMMDKLKPPLIDRERFFFAVELERAVRGVGVGTAAVPDIATAKRCVATVCSGPRSLDASRSRS